MASAPSTERSSAGVDPASDRPRLEVELFQLVDDALLKKHRGDGTGWDWGWADWQRDWMDATPHRYAYRCLPLTIANQTGCWLRNPVGFEAVWDGRPEPGTIAFRFDTAEDVWRPSINSQFGAGIITWNTPFLFRTRPQGSRLLVLGPANAFKANAHPLTALIESDWMSMSFTMNWKLMTPGQPVRFEPGEPLFQAIPLARNVCADLEEAAVSIRKLDDDPELARAYRGWSEGRRNFHQNKAEGRVRPDGWQKDYFQGRDADGQAVAPEHMTKVKPPTVSEGPAMPAAPPTVRLADRPAEPEPEPEPPTGRRPSPTRLLPGRTRRRPRSLRDVPAAAAVEPATASASASDAIGDDWRRWIAENLLREMDRDGMREAMVAAGIDPTLADRELDLAEASPYLRGADRLCNRVRKRDWLLTLYRKLDRMRPGSDAIDRRHKLSRAEFLNEYYGTNRPVLITGMMDDWPALRRWSLDDFRARFGDRTIEVQVGRNADARYEVDRDRFRNSMTFAEYVDRLRNAGVTNDLYLTANNNSSNKQILPELWDDIGPVAEYLDGSDRAGFFWLGPAGTITPFHHDLTNNFMAQVMGRKRVKIVPAWDLPLMKNEFHCYSGMDGGAMPPGTPEALDAPQVLECILGPGELLFLPIGCLHYVEALDVSATVSFTNFAFDNDFSSFYTTYHEV